MRFFKNILLILFILLNSCEEPELYEWSKLNALLNDKSWEASAIAVEQTIKRDSVFIQATVFNTDGYLREIMTLSYLPIKIGRYPVFSRFNAVSSNLKAKYATISDDGDVVEDRFNVFEADNNFVEILSVNQQNKEIQGSFQLTFIRDQSDKIENPSLPDTIRFINGTFRIRIVKE